MDPKGHAAIVTGAASGLGAETAAAWAQAGAKVACLDVNIEGARTTASRIGGIAIQCDVTSADGAVAALPLFQRQRGPAALVARGLGVGGGGPRAQERGGQGQVGLVCFVKEIWAKCAVGLRLVAYCDAV